MSIYDHRVQLARATAETMQQAAQIRRLHAAGQTPGDISHRLQLPSSAVLAYVRKYEALGAGRRSVSPHHQKVIEMSTSTESQQVSRLIDFCRDREREAGAVGAVAQFVRDNIETNPPDDLPRWTRNLAAFKKFARHARPPVSPADIDAALAASLA